jgi:hypothetical protein
VAVPANNSSVRLQILKNIVTTFQAVQATEPTDDPMAFQFTTVAIGPLADFDHRKRLSMGVHVGSESVSYKFESTMCFLTINLELKLTVNRDDPAPGELLEQVIAMAQRVVMANRKWGGLAIDTKITNTEVDLLTYLDRSAMASLVVVVQYRFSYADPRNPAPGGS